MATQTGTPTAALPRRTIALACTAALALAALAGIGGWQVGAHSRSSAKVTPLTRTVAVAAPQSNTAVAAALPRPAVEAVSVVLVRSARDAADLEAQLAASANLSLWQGAPPLIIVASDDASADFDRHELDLANEERAAHGLPGIVVTDLTQPVAVPARTYTAPSNNVAPSALTAPQSDARRLANQTPTVYLVDTPAQASTLQAALNDTDAMRSQSGEPSRDDHVRVVDATTAAQLQQDIASQNGFRAVLGLPPITVQDLRQPRSATAPRGAERPAVYLVDSEEQATSLRLAAQSVGAVLQLNSAVVVSPLAGQARLAVEDVQRKNETLSANHLSTIIVVDVRSSPTTDAW